MRSSTYQVQIAYAFRLVVEPEPSGLPQDRRNGKASAMGTQVSVLKVERVHVKTRRNVVLKVR